MKRNEAILADDALEKNKIAKDFVAFMHLSQQMFAETCSSFGVAQGARNSRAQCGRTRAMLHLQQDF